MNIELSNTANLPSRFGIFEIQAFKEGEKEHLAIYKKPFGEVVNVRIHSECLTGDAIGSLKCDCRDQLEASLKYIEEHGGMVIYLRQEGRNIGLLNKVNAYHLGFKADERTYEIVDFILKHFGIEKINLLTNNPKKLSGLKCVQIVSRVPIVIHANKFNENYLRVKKEQMGHMLDEN